MKKYINLVLVVLIVTSFSSCVTKRPYASSVSSPDYNSRIKVKNPQYVKKEDIRVSIGISALGGFLAYNNSIIKPVYSKNQQSAKIWSGVVGTVVTYSLTRWVTGFLGKNRMSDVADKNKWVSKLKGDYIFVKEKNLRLKEWTMSNLQSKEWTIINSDIEPNYTVKNLNDIKDFKLAFPNSQNAEKLIVKSLYVLKREDIPTVLQLYPNTTAKKQYQIRYYELSKNVSDLQTAKKLYPEAKKDFNICKIIDRIITTANKDDLSYLQKEYRDRTCINKINSSLINTCASLNDCLRLYKKNNGKSNDVSFTRNLLNKSIKFTKNPADFEKIKATFSNLEFEVEKLAIDRFSDIEDLKALTNIFPNAYNKIVEKAFEVSKTYNEKKKFIKTFPNSSLAKKLKNDVIYKGIVPISPNYIGIITDNVLDLIKFDAKNGWDFIYALDNTILPSNTSYILDLGTEDVNICVVSDKVDLYKLQSFKYDKSDVVVKFHKKSSNNINTEGKVYKLLDRLVINRNGKSFFYRPDGDKLVKIDEQESIDLSSFIDYGYDNNNQHVYGLIDDNKIDFYTVTSSKDIEKNDMKPFVLPTNSQGVFTQDIVYSGSKGQAVFRVLGVLNNDIIKFYIYIEGKWTILKGLTLDINKSLQSTLFNPNFDVIKRHINRFDNIDEIYNVIGFNPLSRAVYFHKIDVVKYLLNKGANPNSTFKLIGQKKRTTPLLIACKLGKIDIVKLLVENGADVNLLNPLGFGENEEILDFLLEKGSKPQSDIAYFNAGQVYYNKGEYKKAFDYIMVPAKRGDSDAQRAIGLMYYNGQGVKKNINKSIMWLKRAKNNGDEKAAKLYKQVIKEKH